METNYNKVTKELFGRQFEIETGKMAKQANGAVFARYGDTVVIATIVSSTEKSDDDFLPLTVNYQEKAFASGRIPGGYFKREGRPTEKEILTSRFTDRSLRPLFAKDYRHNTQIIITAMSADEENDPDILCLTAASACIMVSDVPFDHALAAVRVGRIAGELVCNPTKTQQALSDLDLIVAGTRDAIVMVEGTASEVSEADMVEALEFAHESIIPFIDALEELASGIEVVKREMEEPEDHSELIKAFNSIAEKKLGKAIRNPVKAERKDASKAVFDEASEQLAEQFPEKEVAIADAYDNLKKELMRELVVKDHLRLDGRGFTDIRQISTEVGLLPRTHGSALFTRGETQAIVVTTLGTSYDEQRIDTLEGEIKKSFMLHYNFPPFSVGETSFRLGPGRREIGHGNLAERSIKKVLPAREDFPYTIRIVSDVLESNGSSSMATICGTSMSLMDTGVPIKAPVAGIAMGLIKEGDEFAILSDILGDEDHLGDMDFKVAGTESGITGLQMDIKVTGVTREILTQALEQARVGRLHILSKMAETIGDARHDLSSFAPRIHTMMINKDRIKDLIGPGGKHIKGIIEETGVTMDVDDTGTVNIASADGVALARAIAMVEERVQEAEPGKVYFGLVKKVLDFGAFVEIFPGTDGLVHISELEFSRVQQVTDVLNEGDEVLVKCLAVDKMGKIRLSRKEALDLNIEDYRK